MDHAHPQPPASDPAPSTFIDRTMRQIRRLPRPDRPGPSPRWWWLLPISVCTSAAFMLPEIPEPFALLSVDAATVLGELAGAGCAVAALLLITTRSRP